MGYEYNSPDKCAERYAKMKGPKQIVAIAPGTPIAPQLQPEVATALRQVMDDILKRVTDNSKELEGIKAQLAEMDTYLKAEDSSEEEDSYLDDSEHDSMILEEDDEKVYSCDYCPIAHPLRFRCVGIEKATNDMCHEYGLSYD